MVPSLRTLVTMREENGGSLAELADAAKLLQVLLKKYWNKLHLAAVQEMLSKEHAGLVSLMHILKRMGKLQPGALAQLQHMAWWASLQETVTVRSSSPKVVDDLVKDATVLSQEAVGLTVQSDSKIYKRSLDRDLEKVLGK